MEFEQLAISNSHRIRKGEMKCSRGAFDWAILATTCVLLVFLFPVPHGSFTAMNGPVTALRAMRESRLLHGAIALAASVFVSYSIQTAINAAITIDVLCRAEACSGRDLLKRSSTLRC